MTPEEELKDVIKRVGEDNVYSVIYREFPWHWAVYSKLRLQACMFSTTGMEYQAEIMNENKKRKKCALKGAQMAISTSFMLRSVHGLINGKYPKGVIYFFPTSDDASIYSKSQLQPIISNNPGAVGSFIKDTDAVEVKRINDAVLYMRGAKATRKVQDQKESSTKLKSIPGDCVVFDEYDEMDFAMVLLAIERMADSKVAEEIYLSTPTIPDFGIDKLYSESDQRLWMIKCKKCGKYTCLEEEFPNCLEKLPNGDVIRLCQRCRDSEIFPQDGRWIARYPDREMAGWWISQLNKVGSVIATPKKILEAYENPPEGRLEEVYNSKLARAYVAAHNRLGIAEILSLCSNYGIASDDDGPCFMGVDQGNKLHVVVGKKHYGKRGQLIHMDIYKDFEELDRLMRIFNVQLCVIDATPNTHSARDFAKRHAGRVYLSFYQEHQKGMYRWDESNMTVASNRTESLDASQNEVMTGGIVFPKECEIMRIFAKHLHNVAKKLEEDKRHNLRYKYLKLGEDHFRHAYNYECMARTYFQPTVFDDLDFDGVAI
ncbi:MAG: phage tail protein [PVC group bacterium]|nr:phage tail protein [PVC group bacterium]